MKIGIVIQGQYIYNYTFKIIDYYKQILKDKYNYVICLSIWEEDIDNFEYKKVKSLGVYVILNKKPKISGHWNINYQIVSTINGLRKLKQLNCDIAIKVRTDFKWKLDYFIDYYVNQNNSKICCLESCDDLIGYPFVINDFIFIGEINELIELFDIPLYNFGHQKNVERKVLENRESYKQLLINQPYIYFSNRHYYNQYDLFAEPYLVRHYLEKKGNILPKNKVLLYYQSIFLMTLYFDLLIWDKEKMGGSNIKKHFLPSINKFDKYKKMIENKHFIRLWIKSFNRAIFIDNFMRIYYQIKFLVHTVKYSFINYKF